MNTDDISHALAQARRHLKRCEEELDRWQEPTGGDYRGTLEKLQADVRRAQNDVEVLAVMLAQARAAQFAADAFEA